MQTSINNNRHPGAPELQDPLFQTPLRWFRIVAAATVLSMGAVLADICLRSSHQDRQAARAAAQIGLSWAALSPAGSPLGRSDMHHPGVDLRFTPQLPWPHSIGLFQIALTDRLSRMSSPP